jgi:hypothetical protein
MSAKEDDDHELTSKVVYFGVINMNEGTKNIGSVDIWRNVVTKEFFCEEKRIGALDLSDKIGMHQIKENKKWAVAVNRRRKGTDRWKLLELIEEGKLRFTDLDDQTTVDVNVEGFSIVDSEWWSFLVEQNINRTIDLTNEPSKNDTQ